MSVLDDLRNALVLGTLSAEETDLLRRLVRAHLVDEAPLVRFFRERAPAWGQMGDYNGWSPEETAVHLLTVAQQAIPFYQSHAVSASEVRHLHVIRGLPPEARRQLDAFAAFLVAREGVTP